MHLPQGLRIVLIDSDPLMHRLTQRWLREAGCRVVGASALTTPTRGRIDLLIVDSAQPRLEAARLRTLLGERELPVLLLSARLRSRVQHPSQLAEELGVGGVLAKPFTREALLDAVAQALAPP